MFIAVRASAAVVTEVRDPDMIRNSQRLKPGAIKHQGRLFLTLCLGARAALATLILASRASLSCKAVNGACDTRLALH